MSATLFPAPPVKTERDRILDAAEFRVDAHDLALFHRELAGFIPPGAFDIHAHLYNPAHFASTATPAANGRAANSPIAPVGSEIYRRQQRGWLGDAAPQDGLFFAFPAPQLDMAAANAFVLDEVPAQHGSRALMLVAPQDDPAHIESQVIEQGWSGFKVYHLYASRPDTMNAAIGEFLPEWAWEIAGRHRLAIMLHLVRPRALADTGNQAYIREHCRRYPGARLILAHAGRGFCGQHTVEGIGAVAGLDNLYFDTSAICEAAPFEAILRTYGPTRLLYGSDFPISEAHGRCISVGDGFHWLYEWHKDDWTQGNPVLIGLESLRALREACRHLALNDSDLELIFRDNARDLLRLETGPAMPHVDEQQLYRSAKRLMPGGTQLLSKRPEMFAPDRWPPYFREARGCEIATANGNRLLDFSYNGIGSCLLGYAHPVVTEAVLRRVRLGAMSTLNPPEEIEVARRLIEWHPWATQARFARTGGEALAAAIRIARASTGRDVIAFCGYHGWQDWYLAANLAGENALGGHLMPGLDPTGVPQALRGSALPFHYNDLPALQKIVHEQGKNLAAVVMEPTRNLDPEPGFLEGVRALCDESGARLVFDEVTIGFRLCRGGAHLKLGIEPDLAVFAKALGSGHPMAAILGRASTMEAAQRSFISSTYWTESVGPTATLATLDVLAAIDVPAHIAHIGLQFRETLRAAAEQHAVGIRFSGHPCLTTFGFEHEEAAALLTLYTIEMLEHGFLAAAGFYPTLAHNEEHVARFGQAAAQVMEKLSGYIAAGTIAAALQTPVKHSGFARLN